MPADADDKDLLARLASGESAVAENLFAAYAPFLRAVVRCHLTDQVRGKLDSADVVQSVWVQVVRQLRRDGWHVNDEDHLKALLATIARRRLVTRIRQNARSVDAAPPSDTGFEQVTDARHPRPSEVAQANDLWEKMLELCPTDHHEILHLKREGLPLAEIASRTGLHEGSVRRILRRLSRDLAMVEELPPSPESSPLR